MLAAGQGRRFGGSASKLLAPWRGRPILAHVLDAVSRARARDRVAGGVVVVPVGDSELSAMATATGLKPVPAPGAERGMSVSLAAGIAALARHADADAALILLGDQPRLSDDAVDRVIDAAGAARTALCRARYAAQMEAPGHPVLLGREWWPVVDNARGDRGLDRLVRDRGLAWREIILEGSNPDVDSPDDLERLNHA